MNKSNPKTFCAFLLLFLLAAIRAAAAAQPIMRVSELEPGMEGVALTVMQGGEPEEMPVRILGVLEKANSGGDLILGRLLGEKFEHTGVAAGMSGSPVYIQGKLVGAIGYAWSFSKDPICGITPIEDMLSTIQASNAWPETPKSATQPMPDETLEALAAGRAPETPHPGLRVNHPATGPGELARIATPVSVSGLNERGRRFLQGALEQAMGAPVSVTGGGGGSVDATPGATALGPGHVLSVTLMNGDMDAAALGTVTYRDDDILLGFGHPMFNWGKVSLPMGGGVIQHVMASSMSSFKMGDPASVTGTLVHDGQFAIMARLGQIEDTLLPATMTVRERETGREKTVRVNVFNHKDFLTSLLYTALYNTVSQVTGDMGEATARVRLRVTIKEWPEPLEITDMYYSSDLFFIGALEYLSAIVNNPFLPVTVESVNLEMEISRERRLSQIRSMSLAQDRVRPGDTITLNVEVEPFGQAAETVPVTVTIPANAAPGLYKILVMSGVERGPMSDAPPVSFEQYIRYIGQWAPNNSMVALTIYPEKAPAVRGEELMEAPASMRDAMFMSSNYSGVLPIDKQDRKVIPMDRILLGSAFTPVFVEKK